MPTLKERFADHNQTYHVSVTMSMLEVENLAHRIVDAVATRLIDRLSLDLMPMMMEHVEITLDRAKLTKAVEDHIIAKMVEVLSPRS